MSTQATGTTVRVPRARIVAALGAALFFAVFAVSYVAAESDALRATVTTALTTIAATFALVASVWAFSKSKLRQRNVWASLLIANSAFLVGWIYRTIYVSQNADYPGQGSLEDIVFAAGYLCLIPAVLFMSQPRQGVRLSHLRQVLDLASIVVAMLAGLTLLLLIPLRLVGADTSLAAGVSFSIYMAISTGLVVYLLAFKHTRWTSSEALIMAGLIAAALGMLLVFSAFDAYQPANLWTAWPNSLVTAAFLFFGLAGVHAATREAIFSQFKSSAVVLPTWTQNISAIIALVVAPWLIVAASQAGQSFTRTFITTLAVILAITIASRNIVMNLENRQLAERAIYDPLTGLYNRKHLHERAHDILDELRTGDTDTCLCTIVVDDLDGRVRRYGFPNGDRLMKTLARRIESVAGLDTAYRIGGDRFSLLLQETNAVEAYDICNSVMAAVEPEEPDDPITLSIGIASARMTTTDAEVLISYAAGAAYWASSNGGDRVVLFDPEVVKATDSRSHVANIEEQSQTRLLEALAAAVDARDPYTRHHSANVAQLVEAFAQQLELPAERVLLLRDAALMHDLGKIGIPDSVLLKPGKLTDDEFTAIRSHSELGARILSSGSSSEIISWVRSHHERWDGQGYPDGISSTAIPYEARILTICDSYDAMTSDRPYRQGLSVSQATEEIKRCAGTQFDPSLVEPFLEALFQMWPETGGRAFRVTSPTDTSGRATVKGQ